jgi:cytochrome-b5 reductase
MSSHLHALKEGDLLEVRGPVGRFRYHPNAFKCIGLVAGGTGITPCLQLIRCILEGPERNQDKTKFILFYQNRTEEDILLHDEIEKLVKAFPSRLTVSYFLSNPSDTSWGLRKSEKSRTFQMRGYINQRSIQLLNTDKCQLVTVCGPSGFNKSMTELLINAGHEENGNSLYIW